MAKTKKFKVNKALIEDVLYIIDGGLSCGISDGEVYEDDSEDVTPKSARGKVCVEAAVSIACGEGLDDGPSCVDFDLRELKIRLNDEAPWKSKKARAKGLRRFAIAQIGTSGGKFNFGEFSTLIKMPRFEEELAKFTKGVAKIVDKGAKDVDGLRMLYENLEEARYDLDSQDLSNESWGTQKEAEEFCERCVQALIKMKTPGSKFLYLTEGKKVASKKK